MYNSSSDIYIQFQCICSYMYLVIQVSFFRQFVDSKMMNMFSFCAVVKKGYIIYVTLNTLKNWNPRSRSCKNQRSKIARYLIFTLTDGYLITLGVPILKQITVSKKELSRPNLIGKSFTRNRTYFL